MSQDGDPITVAIEPFRNETDPYEPGIEIALHRAVIEAVMPGPYQLDVADRADLYVTGVIHSFARSTLSRDVNEDPTEVKVDLIVSVTVYRRNGGSWTERNVRPASEPFTISGGELFEDAAARALRRGARAIVAAFTPPELRW